MSKQGANPNPYVYRPYDPDEADISDEETSDIDSTETDMPTSARTGGILTNTNAAERAIATDRWRAEALQFVNGSHRVAAASGPGRSDNGLGMYNTRLKFEEKRVTTVLMVDSLDRDQRAYPLPTQIRLKLPRVYKNVERIDIVQVKLLSGLYTISEVRGNNILPLSIGGVPTYIEVPDGTYTIQQLVTTMGPLLDPYDIAIEYSCMTGRVKLKYTGAVAGFTFSLMFGDAARASATTEWGLGWNLGFGGLPVNLTGALVYIADFFPRLFTDYIYLRLNDTEHMNMIDHTSLENTAYAQESTGQVSHYFGKLLMAPFGCYAQTFIESPKIFKPVLGRLERLNFEWVDRHGTVLAGPDAATCDWHMALRITEIHETPVPTSSLALGHPDSSDSE
jgi:hypothetical protein